MTIDEAIMELTDAPSNLRFARLRTICETFFVGPRIRGSHHIFSVPWPGNPRINIQPARGGRAVPYQVKQVLAALIKLEGMSNDTDD